MNTDLHKQTEPVCKFGPGGDFVTVWPKEPTPSPQPATNHLAKFLTSIAEIMTALLGSEFNTTSADAGNIHRPTPAPVIKSDSPFPPVQPMLFPGDWGIGARTGHKPKRCIRAYHRTAKRRLALSLPAQASLFETNFRSTKTA